MKYINFSNIEELIFHDRRLQSLLPPQMRSHFEIWRMSKLVPMLRPTGKQSLLDCLNELTEKDIKVLEEYFNDKIVVEKLNYSIVLDTKVPLQDFSICEELCEVEGYSNFTTWRDDDFLYITHWR
jgi:hypothetical protein